MEVVISERMLRSQHFDNLRSVTVISLIRYHCQHVRNLNVFGVL